jgi:adenine-specific DNA glycosylase
MSLLAPSVQKKFLTKLLAWYKKNGRHDMPWRKTRDPYANGAIRPV